MIQLFVDSACDLSENDLIKYNLKLLPFTVTMLGKEYEADLRWRNISPELFLKTIELGEIPIQGRTSLGRWKDIIEESLKEGNDVLYIAISHLDTSSLQAFNIIKNMMLEKYPSRKIDSIDTNTHSLIVGKIAIELSKLNDGNHSIQFLKDTVNNIRDKYHFYAAIETPKFLNANGRTDHNSTNCGILSFDKEGNILIIEDYDTFDKALDALKKYIKGNITYIHTPFNTEKTLAKAKDMLSGYIYDTYIFGPSVLALSGRDAIAIVTED